MLCCRVVTNTSISSMLIRSFLAAPAVFFRSTSGFGVPATVGDSTIDLDSLALPVGVRYFLMAWVLLSLSMMLLLSEAGELMDWLSSLESSLKDHQHHFASPKIETQTKKTNSNILTRKGKKIVKNVYIILKNITCISPALGFSWFRLSSLLCWSDCGRSQEIRRFRT